MKFDLKTSIIVILSSVILFLSGYILGNQPSRHTPRVLDAESEKKYKDSVAMDIREFGDAIGGCYRDFLTTKPKVSEGKIDLILKVQENGAVLEIEVAKNELSSDDLKKCVLDKLSSLRLKPLPNGLNPYIAHSLAFKSEATLQKEIEIQKNRMPKVLPRE